MVLIEIVGKVVVRRRLSRLSGRWWFAVAYPACGAPRAGWLGQRAGVGTLGRGRGRKGGARWRWVERLAVAAGGA